MCRDKTRNVYYIDNHEIAELSRDEIHFYNIDREEIDKEMVEIKWDAESAEKGGYEHFMLKEIHEQPKAVQDMIGAYVKDGVIDFTEVGITEETFANLQAAHLHRGLRISLPCGHGGQICAGRPGGDPGGSGSGVRIPLPQPDHRAGFHGDRRIPVRRDGGQPGGAAPHERAGRAGHGIAREGDYTLYTYAGPEISVATTKAYSTQLIAMYLIAIEAAKAKGNDEARYGELLAEMETLPSKIQKTLDDKERIQWFAAKYANAKDIFFIGRGLDYAISLEGSLKMKEISYIHSEAYAAGELKHGPISLVENGILVVGVCTQSGLFEKTLSNMLEVKSRGAYLMGLTTYGNYNIEDTADFSVYVPKTEEYFTTSLAIVPLQLMGYYVSVAKGLDVDKPRNLAKSVTVE